MKFNICIGTWCKCFVEGSETKNFHQSCISNWSSGIFSFFSKFKQGLDRTADLYFEMAQYMAGYCFDHVI